MAIKLLQEGLGDEASRERFRREALLTSRIRHPSVVQVYEHGIDPTGVAYIVYELVPGSDLAAVAAKAGNLDVATLCGWVLPVAGALHAAHRAGVIHRDVKPQNVLVAESGRIVLCDFGIARPEGAHTVFTAEGLILGTPAFLAPELWTGAPPSPASDQFAWAASVYHIAFGVSVYGSDDPGAVSDLLRTGRGITMPRGGEGVLGPLEPVLLRALDRDPTRRYPDMEAFARAFEEAAGRAPGLQLQPGAAGAASRATIRMATAGAAGPEPSPRSRLPALAAALALVAAAALVTRGAGAREDPAPPPTAPSTGQVPVSDPARAALAQALDKLQELLGENPIRLRETPEVRFERYVVHFEDPLFSPRWSRLVATLSDWLASGPVLPGAARSAAQEPDRGAVELLDRATRIGYRVAQAMEQYSQETHAVPVIHEMDTASPRISSQALGESYRAFVDSLPALFPGLEDRGIPQTPRLALLEALLAFNASTPRRIPMVNRLLGCIRSGCDRTALVRMCFSLFEIVPSDLAGAALDRDQRRQIFDSCLEVVDDPRNQVIPLWRAMIKGLVLRESIRQSQYPDLTPQMIAADDDYFTGVADMLEAESDGTTAWILRRAAVECLKIFDTHPLRFSDPTAEPLKARLRKLQADSQARAEGRGGLTEAEGWEILSAEGL